MQGYFNPYMYPQSRITTVKSGNDITGLPMGVNSEMLAAHETDPIVYKITTDGAGNKSFLAFTISPYIPPKKITMADVMERLDLIERRLNSEPTITEPREPRTDTE